MAVTGLASNKVSVVNRRSGGAFGGKITRMTPVVAAASLGAYVTGKQVHVQFERCQDMIMVRGRGR
jgi:xanthine dehydrogenase/oxidase